MKGVSSKLLTAGTVLSSFVLAGVANAQTANSDDLLQMQKNPAEWVMPTGSYDNHRYSSLDQINAQNASKLQVAWTFSTGVLRGHEGAPLVIGDVMYLDTPFPNAVYALDLNNNGRILWKYEPKQDPNVIPVMCCDTVNRGVAYGDGKIFLHQADTTLVALDAKTGKVVWSVKTDDPSKGATGTEAPMVVKDKVYVGVSGGEFGVRGWLAAYSVKDGHQIWRAYSEGPDSDLLVDPQKTTVLGKPVGADSSLKSWQGDQWKIGGGDTWGWYSYDPQLNLIYYGSGNPSTWNPVQRPGDNKWSMTIFARDPDTGVAKWVYQMTPHDQWDYDGVNEMILADLNMNGTTVPALVHFDRNGFAYTLNRATGALLVAAKYDPAVNWATQIDMNKNSENYGRPEVVPKYSTQHGGEDVNTTGICPAALGTKDEQPATYSPDTGLFYVPTNHVCMDYEPFRVSYTAGQPYVGATLSMYPPPGSNNMGNFIAWDARTGKIVWSDPEPFSVWSGALATKGGVVFYGTLEGYLKAVDAKTGKELYSFKTPSGIIGNVMTYEHNGKQYVAVLSGVGGWAGIGLAAGLTDPHAGLGAVGGYAALNNYTSLGGSLTVFTLPSS
jgi:PQQ-dependent dehydrogenase (methanol/ethanol family)